MPPKQSAKLHLLRTSRQSLAVARGVEDRLAHLEGLAGTMQQTLDVQFKRIAALQAELDLFRASQNDH
jgi:hypothetical protein